MAVSETHYESAHLEIEYDPDCDAVRMVWKRFVSGEPFREGLNRGVELLRERGANNWYADLRELGAVDEEDQEWSNEEWFPRAIAAGVQHMAIVRPESVVAEMSVDNIMQEVEGTDLETHNFDDPDEAEAWLASR